MGLPEHADKCKAELLHFCGKMCLCPWTRQARATVATRSICQNGCCIIGDGCVAEWHWRSQLQLQLVCLADACSWLHQLFTQQRTADGANYNLKKKIKKSDHSHGCVVCEVAVQVSKKGCGGRWEGLTTCMLVCRLAVISDCPGGTNHHSWIILSAAQEASGWSPCA